MGGRAGGGARGGKAAGGGAGGSVDQQIKSAVEALTSKMNESGLRKVKSLEKMGYNKSMAVAIVVGNNMSIKQMVKNGLRPPSVLNTRPKEHILSSLQMHLATDWSD